MPKTADGVEVTPDATVWSVLWHYAKGEMLRRNLADIAESDREWVAAESYSTRASAVRAELEEQRRVHEARMGTLRAMLDA